MAQVKLGSTRLRGPTDFRRHFLRVEGRGVHYLREGDGPMIPLMRIGPPTVILAATATEARRPHAEAVARTADLAKPAILPVAPQHKAADILRLLTS